MARARTMLHEDYSVLALIGDGALTGGLAYEGLNNAGASGEPLIVILNDNGMSIDRNVGAMSEHLAPAHEAGVLRLQEGVSQRAERLRRPDARSTASITRSKRDSKRPCCPTPRCSRIWASPTSVPVDGHDLAQLTTTLEWAREMKRPVLVHVRTQKGHGYAPRRA